MRERLQLGANPEYCVDAAAYYIASERGSLTGGRDDLDKVGMTV